MGFTWDHMYDRLKVDRGGLPGKSTQDMLEEFWIAAGYPDGSLGADEKVAFYKSQGAIGDSLGDLENDYWYRVGPNLLAAKGAVFAIDAAQSVNGEQWVLNRGSGGQVLRARAGSVGRAEIRNGVGLILPGVSGNNASIAASPQPTTSLSVRCEQTLDAWVPTVQNATLAKWGTGGSDRQFLFSVDNGSGRLVLYLSTDGGTTAATATSTVSPTPTASGRLGVRADWDTSGTVRFYTKDCGGSLGELASNTGWTQLGSDRTTTVTSALWASTTALRFGSHSGSSYTSGIIHAAHVVIDGTVVASVDFTTQPDLTTSFTCTAGQTVTLTAANAVDTNDPLWLPWTGKNYAYMYNASGIPVNYFQMANLTRPVDAAEEVRVECEAIATPPLQSRPYNCAHYIEFTDAGSLSTSVYMADGTSPDVSTPLATVYATLGITAGTNDIIQIRSTWNPDTDTLSLYGRRGTEYPLESDSNWTLLASAIIAGKQLNTSSQTPRFGRGNANRSWNGKWYRAMRSVNGTIEVDFSVDRDVTDPGASSHTALVGGTVTVFRPSSGLKLAVVTRPIWLFGTDDYLEVADNDLLDFGATDDFTAIAIMRVHGNQSNNARVFDKFGAGSVGWRSYIASGTRNFFGTVADGTFFPQTAVIGMTDAALTVATYRRFGSGTGDSHRSFINNTATASQTDTTTGTLANSVPFTIGNLSGGSDYLDGEILAVGVFRRALSATEIAQIVSWYGAS